MPDAPSAGAPRTALVAVDNFRGVRSVVCRCLLWAGWHVLEAGSADEAQRVIAEHSGPVHLLVADVNLPTVSGAELAQVSAAARPGVLTLFLSGRDRMSLIESGDLNAAAPFLAKPFSCRELLHKIAVILGL